MEKQDKKVGAKPQDHMLLCQRGLWLDLSALPPPASRNSGTHQFLKGTQAPSGSNIQVKHHPGGVARPKPQDEAKWCQANEHTSQRTQRTKKYGENGNVLI